MFSFAVWKYYKEIKEPVLSADGSRPTNFFEMQFILVFLIFLFASRGLAEYAGNLASQTVHPQYSRSDYPGKTRDRC